MHISWCFSLVILVFFNGMVYRVALRSARNFGKPLYISTIGISIESMRRLFYILALLEGLSPDIVR